MSASVAFSQTGIPATIQIVPGPGVGFAGVGADGVGVAGAALDGNGNLQVLLTNAVTVNAGRVGRVVAPVAAGGSSQVDATPLVADVSLVLGGNPGGGFVLSGGLNSSRKLVNKTATDWPVFPPKGGVIDQLGLGNAQVVLAGSSLEFHSPDGATWTSE